MDHILEALQDIQNVFELKYRQKASEIQQEEKAFDEQRTELAERLLAAQNEIKEFETQIENQQVENVALKTKHQSLQDGIVQITSEITALENKCQSAQDRLAQYRSLDLPKSFAFVPHPSDDGWIHFSVPVLQNIFSYLPYLEVCPLEQCCTRWRALLSQSLVWHSLLALQFQKQAEKSAIPAPTPPIPFRDRSTSFLQSPPPTPSSNLTRYRSSSADVLEGMPALLPSTPSPPPSSTFPASPSPSVSPSPLLAASPSPFPSSSPGLSASSSFSDLSSLSGASTTPPLPPPSPSLSASPSPPPSSSSSSSAFLSRLPSSFPSDLESSLENVTPPPTSTVTNNSMGSSSSNSGSGSSSNSSGSGSGSNSSGAGVNNVNGDMNMDEIHSHYRLSIEVKDDNTYVVHVASWDMTLAQCLASDKARRKSNVDENRRVIGIEICSRVTKKLIRELKFCSWAIEAKHELKKLKLESSLMLTELDASEGSNKQLTRLISQTEIDVGEVQKQIAHLNTQAASDQCTIDFLQQQIEEQENRIEEIRAFILKFIENTHPHVEEKKQQVSQQSLLLEQSQREYQQQLSEFKSHKTLLAKEIKSLRVEIQKTQSERDELEVALQQVKSHIASLQSISFVSVFSSLDASGSLSLNVNMGDGDGSSNPEPPSPSSSMSSLSDA